jgi:hypothetical protein
MPVCPFHSREKGRKERESLQQMAEVTREGFRLKKILIEDWKKAREEKQVRHPWGPAQEDLGLKASRGRLASLGGGYMYLSSDVWGKSPPACTLLCSGAH